MNSVITKKDILFFIAFWIILSLGYYFFFKKEIQISKDYTFILYSLFGASAIICVPILKYLIKNIQK